MRYTVENELCVPNVGTPLSAGLDLRSKVDIDVIPNRTTFIPTGLRIALEPNTVGLLFPRSGLSTKYGLRLANGVGVIDADYRGEIIVPIYHDTSGIYSVKAGERIAQLVVMPILSPALFERVSTLDETERGAGGFGSTG